MDFLFSGYLNITCRQRINLLFHGFEMNQEFRTVYDILQFEVILGSEQTKFIFVFEFDIIDIITKRVFFSFSQVFSVKGHKLNLIRNVIAYMSFTQISAIRELQMDNKLRAIAARTPARWNQTSNHVGKIN